MNRSWLFLGVGPLCYFGLAAYVLLIKDLSGWEGLAASIYISIGLVNIILICLALLLNKYWLRMEWNWWKGVIGGILLGILSMMVLVGIARLSSL